MHALLLSRYRVVAADMNERALQTAVEEELRSGFDRSRLFSCVTDVSSEQSVQQLIEKAVEAFGHIDGAFNNAGVVGKRGFHKLHEWSADEYEATMKVNVRGVFLCMKYEILQFLKQRQQQRQSKTAQQSTYAIVNTSSVAGIFRNDGQSVYGASKHAVVGLTRAAALEYTKFVSVVSGSVESPVCFN
jgi:NAD(P)-dependent dehydrogenase (short-subunit alcohol dehydrogenase family)